MEYTGKLISGDFGERTMTFEIKGDMTLQAGEYKIVPADKYKRLVKPDFISNIFSLLNNVLSKNEKSRLSVDEVFIQPTELQIEELQRNLDSYNKALREIPKL